jgi:hypothetical protein
MGAIRIKQALFRRDAERLIHSRFSSGSYDACPGAANTGAMAAD